MTNTIHVTGSCDHPLRRTVVRSESVVFCWACRRWLSEPEAWLVARRWQALSNPGGRSPLRDMLDQVR